MSSSRLATTKKKQGMRKEILLNFVIFIETYRVPGSWHPPAQNQSVVGPREGCHSAGASLHPGACGVCGCFPRSAAPAAGSLWLRQSRLPTRAALADASQPEFPGVAASAEASRPEFPGVAFELKEKKKTVIYNTIMNKKKLWMKKL